MRFAGYVLSLFPLLVVGCGGSVLGPPDGGGDGGPPDASPPDASPPDASQPEASPPPIVDGGACNDLVQKGSSIPMNAVASLPPPHATGGTVSPGTYVLTSATMYTGAGGQTGKMGSQALTLLFTGSNQGFDIQAVSDSGTGNTASSVTATVSSGTLTLTPYCPASGTPQTVSYSSTGGTLTFYVDGGNNVSLVEVMTAVN